jgi:hypothetical protein
MTTERLKLDAIRLDGGTQQRESIDEQHVADLADAIQAGKPLPPARVFRDGSDLWLSRGFHRYHAHRKAGQADIECEVVTGTLRDAILDACGDNAEHGLKRSAADKRKAVRTLLADPEWGQRSDRWVAEAAKVSPPFVASVRPTVNVCSGPRTGRDGRTQDTTNIGRKPKASKPKPSEPEKPKPAAPTPDPPAAAPPKPQAVTAADLLPAVSKLNADVKRIAKTIDGEPFDSRQAALCCVVIVDLLTGETPAYRLVKGGDAIAQADAIYEAYPRKVAPDAAKRAIKAALKKVGFDELLAAVTEFAASPKGQGEFCPHPATWFNEGRWADDRKEWKRAGSNGKKPAAGRSDVIDEYLAEYGGRE